MQTLLSISLILSIINTTLILIDDNENNLLLFSILNDLCVIEVKRISLSLLVGVES
jgi:hypothetical protein